MTLSPPETRRLLRFGSFSGGLTCTRSEYVDALRLVFGVGIHPFPEAPHNQTPQFECTVDGAAIPPTGAVEHAVESNHLTLGGTPANPTITTGPLHAELALDTQPLRIRVTVLRDDVPFDAMCVHFGVVVHKILFLLDRVILHAAAVKVDDEVCVFVGDKGVGKSSTCLALARAGATVLGEDQVVLFKSPAGYRVSGGDDRSRVTERTERHFFPSPLAVEAKDYAGTMKKEVRMGDFFKSEPFRDFPAHRLLFPRVTRQFELRRLKAQPALLRMMAYNGHFQRFAGPRDQAAFLDFLAGFIATVSCWELSLSHDLSELDALAGKLRGD